MVHYIIDGILFLFILGVSSSLSEYRTSLFFIIKYIRKRDGVTIREMGEEIEEDQVDREYFDNN